MKLLNQESLPRLGFGLMRLPKDEKGGIDLPQLCDMVDAYIGKGMNYFDTAYLYHNGDSEKMIKKALVERYPRDAFLLADKLPVWFIHSKEDVRRIFDEQLERTGSGYFDMYLLHAVDAGNLIGYDKYGCWSFLQEMKAQGLVRHIGFSFHDTPELLERVLTSHPEVELVQLQMNYLDWNNELVYSGGNYEVARKFDIPVIAMEPVKGGILSSLDGRAAEILKTAHSDASQASWALRFCASLPGVITVLSGMSDNEQMADNLSTMTDFHPLTPEEKKLLDEVVVQMTSVETIGCTACGYCVDGCPVQIRIPEVIRAYNHMLVYGDAMSCHQLYHSVAKKGHTAKSCTQCGQCEGACPQHLPVIEVMQKASAKFDKK